MKTFLKNLSFITSFWFVLNSFYARGEGKIIISEVTDPDDYSACFIEIYNAGESPQDLLNWYIIQYNSSKTTIFNLDIITNMTGNYTLNPGEYLILIRGTLSDLTATYPTFNGYYFVDGSKYKGVPQINNDEYFELYNNSDEIVDKMGCASSTISKDKTYERIDALSTGENISTDWVKTDAAGTPGVINITVLQNDQNAIPDKKAPLFISNYPKLKNIEAAKLDLVVQLDEPGIVFFITKNEGEVAPTVSEVLTGTAINITIASTDFKATITGLIQNSTYEIYLVAQDDESTPNIQDTTTLIEVTTPVIDLNPPIFISGYPKISIVADTWLEIIFQMDEKGKVYYLIVNNDETTPNKDQVKAGVNYDTVLVVTNGMIEIEEGFTDLKMKISGLTPETSYDMYIVAEDNEPMPNIQSLVTKLDIITTPPPVGELFISEYIEGSSNNKALEIFNGTGTTIDLSPYEIKLGSNGGDWSNILDLTGILKDSHVFVIANFGSINVITEISDTVSGVTNFNGNDALGLFKNEILIDIFGTYQEDPGSAWEVAGILEATKNHTIIRKPYIIEGNINWASSAGINKEDSEWIVYDQDDFDHLGFHGKAIPNIKPSILNVTIIPENPFPTDTVNINASISDEDGIIIKVSLFWGLADNTMIYEITMSVHTGDSIYSTSSPIPPHSPGTDVYFMIEAIDNQHDTAKIFSNYSISPEYSIHEIQFTTDISGDSPHKKEKVITSGIVTATYFYQDELQAYFLQDSTGSWNGIYVNDNNWNIHPGDNITLQGTIEEWNYVTQLSDIVNLIINSKENDLPAPVVLLTGQANNEKYESVLIKVEDAECTNVNLGNGEWQLNDGSGDIIIDNYLCKHDLPLTGSEYDITGILFYSEGAYKILPRDTNDIVLKYEAGQNETQNLESSLIIYPNPNAGEFFLLVNNADTGDIIIEIFNLYGMVVYKKAVKVISSQPEVISIKNIKKGIYFVKIQNEKWIKIIKVVIHPLSGYI